MISLLHSTDVRKSEMNDNVIAMRKRGKGLLAVALLVVVVDL
jgi:hypothetical protein